MKRPAASTESGKPDRRPSKTPRKAIPGEARTPALAKYREKRDFNQTPEPSGEGLNEIPPHNTATSAASPRYVIQKHWARQLHYDFRLEIEGTMKSWAVPKGPSLDPSVKRMAVHVEDHPIAYSDFEGSIPEGQYGAGKVIIWDRGHWTTKGDPGTAYRSGKLAFELTGTKLQGRWALVRMGSSRKGSDSKKTADANGFGDPDAGAGDHGKQDAWLLIKERDAHARPQADFDVTEAFPESVVPPPRHDALPKTLAPQLATRVSAPPSSAGWVYELKYDGYRILTRMCKGRARLHTRRGHDWTQRLPALAQALESESLPDGWYDGEIVVLDSEGRPDFQALQNALDAVPSRPSRKSPNGRSRSAPEPEIAYFLFDLPWLAGDDLRKRPLAERQTRLASILENVEHPALRLSHAFDAPAADMLRSACRLGLEGIIGKRRDSFYAAGRSGHWIKLKCGERQEFVVGGYTAPKGSRAGLGSLLLGYYDEDGGLHYAGNVGSGFSDASLGSLHRQLRTMHRETPPFVNPPPSAHASWVKPELAAEVSFSGWTDSGRVRHAVFHGLREDKPTPLMKKEHARTITHPARVVDARSGTHKGDVATYYERLAPLMMPHLKDRPVSLLRAPDGIAGELFFQKHMKAARLQGLMQLDPALDPGHDPLIVVRDASGLAEAAQLNVIEFHTWNAVRSRIDRPDRISFDLDPGEGVKWAALQEAAVLLHSFLQELELPAFVKTSGGKGLHVIVPIVRRYDWDTVKDFSRAVVQHMSQVLPQRFSAKSGPRNRVGRIFIDYLRNGFGATTVAAWSLRARPGMGVSVPVGWEEVERLEGGNHWTIANIDERLETGNQPWADYENSASALGPARKRLGLGN